jgi:hypothetical protein
LTGRRVETVLLDVFKVSDIGAVVEANVTRFEWSLSRSSGPPAMVIAILLTDIMGSRLPQTGARSGSADVDVYRSFEIGGTGGVDRETAKLAEGEPESEARGARRDESTE